MRKSNQRRQRVFRPQHVGDLGYRQQAGARVKQSRDNIQLQRTVRVQGITRSSAPTRAQSICHGTILAWCSISLMMMLSPAPTLAFPSCWPPC